LLRELETLKGKKRNNPIKNIDFYGSYVVSQKPFITDLHTIAYVNIEGMCIVINLKIGDDIILSASGNTLKEALLDYEIRIGNLLCLKSE